MASHIKIGDVSPRIQYTADGVQAAFTYPFPIFENVDLEVYAGAALQSTGFTISGAGDSVGGLVTFDAAPLSGVIVTLARRLNIQRTSDFQESGQFRSKVINDELDYLTASLQQVSDDQSRSLQMSITESKSVDTTLPTPVANMSIVWNDTESGFVNGPTIDEISSAQLYASSASASSVAAATSAGQAATSAAAALAATVGKYDARISIASADSPYTVTAMTQDTLLNVDTTGGAVVVNLPPASGEADNRLLGINKSARLIPSPLWRTVRIRLAARRRLCSMTTQNGPIYISTKPQPIGCSATFLSPQLGRGSQKRDRRLRSTSRVQTRGQRRNWPRP